MSYSYLVLLVFVPIVVEAITEILVSSSLFSWWRNAVARVPFFGTLFTCGYCLSVWVSAGFGWIFDFNFVHPVFDYFIVVFLIHRLANIYHELFQRWFDKHPFVLMLSIQKSDEQDEGEDDESGTGTENRTGKSVING